MKNSELVNHVTNSIMEQRQFVTTRDTLDIYSYNGQIWTNSGETYIMSMAEDILKSMASKSLVSEIIEKIKRKTLADRTIFSKNHKTISLENCALNPLTYETEELSPGQFHITQIPVEFIPGADCPNITKFIDQSMAEYSNLFYEIMAFCLMDNYRYKKFFIFIGERDTGKTTAINIMRTFLGHGNITEMTLQHLSDNRFAIANLYGKLANICDDLPAIGINDIGRIKELTGNSPVSAEMKFTQAGLSFINRAKLVFSCNKIPRTKSADDAFYSRVIIVPFENQVKNPDPELIDKLTTPQELSGLLNKVLRYYHHLIERKHFGYDKTTDEIIYMYNLGSLDSVTRYLNDCIEPDMIAEPITRDSLYDDYIAYCQLNKLTALAGNAFHRRMHENGYLSTSRVTVDNERKYIYSGIRIIR